ncbi:hypothetical protein ASG29_07385 [Sphingomonas sp. Leaf412]|uniref:hypothetical protein n=1 Tax=Sphingomonas sp. Leaf412 TaxID=1736370 RepID=UPI0006F67AB1|nr:hypothetical protein [Sphingomonas sp. Leaf412]KQT31736.1 hypothetical protein ASG29_07385 [Sphingomonas sp. Leaf412]
MSPRFSHRSPRLSTRLAAAALTIGVAACVPAPAPPPAPRPAPVAPPAPPPTPTATDWQDRPVTPGTWRYARDDRGSRATFGTPGGAALAIVRCDRGQRTTSLSRPGTAAGALTVRTTAVTRTLAVRPDGGTPPHVVAALSPRDPLLDAIAFSRGRFTMETGGEEAGATALVLPPWAEVARVIEDCRD